MDMHGAPIILIFKANGLEAFLILLIILHNSLIQVFALNFPVRSTGLLNFDIDFLLISFYKDINLSDINL